MRQRSTPAEVRGGAPAACVWKSGKLLPPEGIEGGLRPLCPWAARGARRALRRKRLPLVLAGQGRGRGPHTSTGHLP